LQVTGFTAGRAIINAVFAQADVMEALAERAIFIAGAASLRLVTHHAAKVFRHDRRLARFGGWGNGPMVDGLAEHSAKGKPGVNGGKSAQNIPLKWRRAVD
jgi:hypothetical protein